MFQSLMSKGLYLYRAVRTSILYSFSRSDVGRWGREESLNPSWDTRTKLIASLIPERSSVLEFGAGRLALQRYLPASCLYTPSDIADRGAGTIVCDLNGEFLPVFPYHDIMVFGGVLEYIFDLDRLLAHLTDSCNGIVASYATTDVSGQRSTFQRRKYGWVNKLSENEIVNKFSGHGFVLKQTLSWENQHIFRFVNEKRVGGSPI
jgi:hypothetical protein